MDLNQKFPVDATSTKKEVRKCWWVYFDVDGYAPSDEYIVACSTEALAKEVKGWFAAKKEDDKEPYVVLEGKKYSEMVGHGVEGYNWACRYRVEEGEAETKQIMTSLAEVVRSGIFEFDEDTAQIP